MRDVFIIDNSIFEDALTDSGREGFKQSSIQLIDELFRLKLDEIDVGYIPIEAYRKIASYFGTLKKTKAIKLISNIVNVEPSTKPKLKVVEAIQNLAYKFTLIPQKAYLVTNNFRTYTKLLQSDRMFYVINSDEALMIIQHRNFITKD